MTLVREEFSARPWAAALMVFGEKAEPEMSHVRNTAQTGHELHIASDPFSFRLVSPRSSSSSVLDKVFDLVLRIAASALQGEEEGE